MVSFKLVLFASKTLKDGKHPVMLKAANGGKAKYHATGYSGSPNEWDTEKERFRKNVPDYKSRNDYLEELELFADSLTTEARLHRKRLTLETFMARIKNDQSSGKIVDFFKVKIKELQNASDAGNAFIYTCAMNALVKFGGTDVLFSEVDYNFLIKFENHLRCGGAHDGGISNYFRTIRALFNEAIRRGLVEQTCYPFSTQFNKNGYSISKLMVNIKSRALSKEDLELVKNFPHTEHLGLQVSYLMFMFSFYQVGVNFTDIARLKKENLQGGLLVFKRQKTKKKTDKLSKNPLHPKAKEILAFFALLSKDGYLFPILTAFHKTEQQKFDRIQKRRRHFNKDLKKIAAILGIEANITSYYSRHSAAMAMKRKGVSEDVICETLGIIDPKTRKHYLASFEDEVLENAMAQL